MLTTTSLAAKLVLPRCLWLTPEQVALVCEAQP